MSKPTQPTAKSEQTRADLLHAAEALFYEQGVAHTSLEQIARHAGVTRGAIYWHFKNKADLFHAILNQVCLPTEAVALHIRQAAPGEPLNGLRNLCVEVLRSMLTDERKKRIFTILLRRCEFTKELREAEKKHDLLVKDSIHMCAVLLAEHPSTERLKPGITPHMVAVAIHALFHGLLNDWLRDNELIDIENCAPYFDALLDGFFLPAD